MGAAAPTARAPTCEDDAVAAVGVADVAADVVVEAVGRKSASDAS